MNGTQFKNYLPGIESYSGRYAYFAFAAGLLLLALAYFGWVHVNRSSQHQISQIESRAFISGVLASTSRQLDLLENSLQKIIIQPDSVDLQLVDNLLTELGSSVSQLEPPQEDQKPNHLQLLKELKQDLKELEEASHDLIAIRTDSERWFPALHLMREEMHPHNQQLLSLLDALLEESSEELTLEDSYLVWQTATDLRRAWLNMIAELRLYVANRFGIFSTEPQRGMKLHLTNILYHSEEIPQYLDSLNQLADAGRLGFVAASSLTEITQHYEAWLDAFNELSKLLANPNWRMDLLILTDMVNPILDRIRQRLSSLHLELEAESGRDITQLTEISRQLSKSILALSLSAIAIILFAYLFLKRNLLHPIAQTALALKQEAQGLIDIEPPPAKLQETRDLIDAFTEMRMQIRTRQRSLDHMAHHDALTELPNRILFRDRLKHALEIAGRGNYLVGLMFLDLDRFKQVNDSLGHLIGDELLKIVAERLQSIVRSSDTVARLSGDEFAILVEGLEQRDDIVPLAEKALSILEKPIEIADHQLRISASIGIAIAPHDDISAEHLIRDADTAMYQAKRQGRSAYRFFTGDMTHLATESLNLENEVRMGAEQQQFFYQFQPVISLNDDSLQCCEALLRWRHPVKGVLSPDVFLDVLDTTGIISSIMDGLLNQAERHQRQISQLYGRTIAVSINLSVRLLNDPAFCRGVLERLIAGQFANGGLVLELTEDILTQELAEADVFLHQVKTLGARVALDDFGTGQASLSHLRQFPFDLLKIDRAFIHSVDTDPNHASLVEAITKLAHAFNMPVVAEGVESEGQKRFVKHLGSDYIQGHLVGMPMESDQLIHRAEDYL